MIDFFFHHKWDEAWLLVINMVHTSWFMSCRTTSDWGNIRKILNFHRNIAYCPAFLPKWKFRQYYQNTAEKTKLNFSRSALLHIKTRVCLKHFVNGCFYKLIFASNSLQTPSKLILLTIFVTWRPLTQFQPNIRATKIQKSAKICLTW